MALMLESAAPTLPTSRGINRALSDLGHTADEIAQSLFVRGIQGRPCSLRHCPISVYLRQCFDFPVLTMANYLMTEHADRNYTYTLPEEVTLFVGLFDSGAYPELDLSWVCEPQADTLALVPA